MNCPCPMGPVAVRIYVSRNVLHPYVDACEFNYACRRRLYMAAIFRYCFVYMFV